VRRAPKYAVFFTVGAIVGIVAGLWFGTWLVDQVDPRRGEVALLKPGVFITVIVAATTTVTVLLAGLLAVLADRRSLRRR
jgi:O-antigen/teichoic acid export membrane protein